MRLTRRTLLESFFFFAANLASRADVRAEVGRSLPLFYPEHPGYKWFYIHEPGHYALNQDEIQRKFWGAGHTGPKNHSLVRISCGSIDLNLNGFTLGADFGLAGIALSAQENINSYKDFLKHQDEWRAPIESRFRYERASLDNRFVSINNGAIDMARGDRTGPAVELIDHWESPGQKTGARGAGCSRYDDPCPPAGIKYERNEYRFEKLKILANELALAAEGSHTVIRDCVIESAGTVAIFVAGPNVTIENCEIRLRKLVDGTDSYQTPTRAAIVLHDGTNAVIRNNRIRVDYGGMPSDTHCILVHDGATNVVIQGNTFINVQGEPVTLGAGAEAVMTDNKSERRWWP